MMIKCPICRKSDKIIIGRVDGFFGCLRCNQEWDDNARYMIDKCRDGSFEDVIELDSQMDWTKLKPNSKKC